MEANVRNRKTDLIYNSQRTRYFIMTIRPTTADTESDVKLIL